MNAVIEYVSFSKDFDQLFLGGFFVYSPRGDKYHSVQTLVVSLVCSDCYTSCFINHDYCVTIDNVGNLLHNLPLSPIDSLSPHTW